MRLVFFLIFFNAFALSAQTSKYNIVLFGSTIGSGTGVQSKTATGANKYKLVTKAVADVMFKERTSSTDIELVYNGNTLESCNLKRESDGEWQYVTISYENGKHYFTENGKKTAVSKPITFTTTLLFFKEPIGVKEVYVERLNIFSPIVKVEEGLYKTVIEGGDNYYKYKNGVLIEFRLKKGINVYMNRL